MTTGWTDGDGRELVRIRKALERLAIAATGPERIVDTKCSACGCWRNAAPTCACDAGGS